MAGLHPIGAGLRYSPLSRQKIGFFKVVRCCCSL
jgi:hypothetical protein